jgi:hypothetical protein
VLLAMPFDSVITKIGATNMCIWPVSYLHWVVRSFMYYSSWSICIAIEGNENTEKKLPVVGYLQ